MFYAWGKAYREHGFTIMMDREPYMWILEPSNSLLEQNHGFQSLSLSKPNNPIIF